MYSIPKIDSTNFTWSLWRGGTLFDLNTLHYRTKYILNNKNKLKQFAIGYCNAENLIVRPKINNVAVMFQTRDCIFWTHLLKKEAKDIVVIETSLVSKYAEICATSSGTYRGKEIISGPSIWLDKNERTIYLDEQHKNDGWTSLVFPTLIGYSIRGTDFGRYSLTITFIKED